MDRIIKYIAGAIGALLGCLFGSLDGLIVALILIVVCDYITGIMVGVSTKQLSSEIGFKGICKKVIIFMLVAVGHIIDTKILQTGALLRTAVIMFYIANEGISILENAGNLGLPIPKKLKDVLEQIKTEEE